MIVVNWLRVWKVMLWGNLFTQSINFQAVGGEVVDSFGMLCFGIMVFACLTFPLVEWDVIA